MAQLVLSSTSEVVLIIVSRHKLLCGVMFKSGCDEFNFLDYRFDFQNSSWFVWRLRRLFSAANNNVAVLFMVGLVARLKVFDFDGWSEFKRLISLMVMPGGVRWMLWWAVMRVAGWAQMNIRLQLEYRRIVSLLIVDLSDMLLVDWHVLKVTRKKSVLMFTDQYYKVTHLSSK